MLMEDVHLLDEAAFSEDNELLHELINMPDHLGQATGIPLIITLAWCVECGGKLILHKDR